MNFKRFSWKSESLIRNWILIFDFRLGGNDWCSRSVRLSAIVFFFFGFLLFQHLFLWTSMSSFSCFKSDRSWFSALLVNLLNFCSPCLFFIFVFFKSNFFISFDFWASSHLFILSFSSDLEPASFYAGFSVLKSFICLNYFDCLFMCYFVFKLVWRICVDQLQTIK